MAPETKYPLTIAMIFVCIIISENEAVKNVSIVASEVSEFNEEWFGQTIYSFLDKDNTIYHQYIDVIQNILRESLFGENLEFLKEIRLKCLPKIYFQLKNFKQSDFRHCSRLNNNLVEVFGKRLLDSCRPADTFTNCLREAQLTFKKDYEAIEEDIVGLYLSEIVGGRDTCMGDIRNQLEILSDIVQKECI